MAAPIARSGWLSSRPSSAVPDGVSRATGSYTVITGSDLHAIRAFTTQRGPALARPARDSDAARLHELSLARQERWARTTSYTKPTLPGSKKQAEALEAERAAEELALVQDAEEERLTEESRAKVISETHRQLWEESERVKTFHSGMHLTEVLAERDQQIRVKSELAAMQKKMEAKYERDMQERIKKDAERDERETAERRAKRRALKEMHESQMDEVKSRIKKRFHEAREEGMRIRRAYEAFEEEQKQEANARRLKAQEINAETARFNELLAITKKDLQNREAEELDKIEMHARKKEAIATFMQERREENFRRKQDIRKRLIERQYKNMEAIRAAEQERLDRQVEEKRVRDDEDDERRREYLRSTQARLQRSWQYSLDKKQQRRTAEEAEAARQREQAQALMERMRQDEHQELVDTRRRNAALASAQLEQARTKQERAAQDRAVELAEEKGASSWRTADDEAFTRYTSTVVKQYREAGKNVKPMLMALRPRNNIKEVGVF